MKEWLRHLFTGADNKTHDLGRWSWAGSFLAVLGATIWNACHNASVDLMNLATALSSVAGAHGFSLWAKKDTEPKNDNH